MNIVDCATDLILQLKKIKENLKKKIKENLKNENNKYNALLYLCV